jgi:hypothetical protein
METADTVINGHMSAQIVKPFPLQFEYCSRYQVFPDTYVRVSGAARCRRF